MSISKLLGVVSIPLLFAACGMTTSKPAPVVHHETYPSNYNNHPIATTPEEDKASLDQADMRANDQAIRSMPSRCVMRRQIA